MSTCFIFPQEGNQWDCIPQRKWTITDLGALDDAGYNISKDYNKGTAFDLAFCTSKWLKGCPILGPNPSDPQLRCYMAGEQGSCPMYDDLPLTCISKSGCQWDDEQKKCVYADISYMIALDNCEAKKDLGYGHSVLKSSTTWNSSDMKLLVTKQYGGDTLYWCKYDQWRPGCDDNLICLKDSYAWY